MVAAITTSDYVAVAEFRAGLRQYLRRSERIARQAGLTPQRYLLLLMIKGAVDGSEQSHTDARVVHLRLTPEGSRRLELAYTGLATERSQLRDAFTHLDEEL